MARPGGYTRILHMLPRAGDAAPMALMQLVDGPVSAAASAPVGKESASPKRARKKAPAKDAASESAAGARPRKRKAAAA
jgi:large subunit ribosomal protein L17